MYSCVAVHDYTTSKSEVEGGGGPQVGVLGQPLSLPPGLQAALPSDGEVTPTPPTPSRARSGWRGRASPHLTEPQAFACLHDQCWPPEC